MASFGTLTISRHLGISGMGVLITLALSYVLLCTLVVLPAVMSIIDCGGCARAPDEVFETEAAEDVMMTLVHARSRK
jgi:hypothetical protein